MNSQLLVVTLITKKKGGCKLLKDDPKTSLLHLKTKTSHQQSEEIIHSTPPLFFSSIFSFLLDSFCRTPFGM